MEAAAIPFTNNRVYTVFINCNGNAVFERRCLGIFPVQPTLFGYLIPASKRIGKIMLYSHLLPKFLTNGHFSNAFTGLQLLLLDATIRNRKSLSSFSPPKRLQFRLAWLIFLLNVGHESFIISPMQNPCALCTSRACSFRGWCCCLYCFRDLRCPTRRPFCSTSSSVSMATVLLPALGSAKSSFDKPKS